MKLFCMLFVLLAVNAFRGGDTHTHTPTLADKMISRNQVRAGHRPAHVCFKNA